MWLSGGYNSIYARIQKITCWKSLKLFEIGATNFLYFAQQYVIQRNDVTYYKEHINVIWLLVRVQIALHTYKWSQF